MGGQGYAGSPRQESSELGDIFMVVFCLLESMNEFSFLIYKSLYIFLF